MTVAILGCGVVGTLIGQRLVARGTVVIGSRRTPWARTPDEPVPSFPVLAGGLLPATTPQAVLIAANPGIRRGRDHGVETLVRLAVERWPQARLVLISTTSLYGDAEGGPVDEQGTLAPTPEALALRAIEVAAESHPHHLVLRATALVGPTRTFARRRVAAAQAEGRPVVVAGDPERPFSYLHDEDLADLAVIALDGGLGGGLLNAACPDHLTVRQYYQAQALGSVTVVGDGTHQPRRRIDATRLWQQVPGWEWRRLPSAGPVSGA